MDFREEILKEGMLKHRQMSYAIPRWKNRYVVFKIAGGGRLQFIIHKEHPPSPANEVKEIPIDEFGGLESGSKVDSEKFVFSVITMNVTDSFSAETVEEMEEWTELLREYLGKELTFGVVINQKQGSLKTGKGVLRIRNTGFTITTSDSPPRCMGTWQITHIRKFGGTNSFKFQTGSKCPTGEMLYAIQTDDNAKVKSLFNDLSQHKPIFMDDRVGRRMTLERNHTHHSRPRQSPGRLSLQSTSSGGTGMEKEGRDSPALSPTYENKEVMTEVAQKLIKQSPQNRRSSSNDDRTPSFSGSAGGHTQQRSSVSAVPGNNYPPPPLSPALSKIDERVYQNVAGRSSSGGSAPHSPTKPHRPGTGTRYPMVPSEPVPDGYYNVSPPLALKKYPITHPSSSSSPANLSPEDDTFFSEFAPVPPPPIKTVSSSSTGHDSYSDAYFRLPPQHRPLMKIEGENLVVQRSTSWTAVGEGGAGGGGGGGELKEDGSITYQNVEFMQKRGSDGANVIIEEIDSGVVGGQIHMWNHSGTGHQTLPIIPALNPSNNDMVHNYTNVEFALEAAQGTMQQARAGDIRRKTSAPPLSRDRSGALAQKDSTSSSSNSPATPVTTTTAPAPTNVTSNLSVSLHPKMKTSLSSHNIQENLQREKNRPDTILPEYYNLFVPRLPANQGTGESDERLRKINHATISSFRSTPTVGSKVAAQGQQGVVTRGEVDSIRSDEEDEDDDKVLVNPTLARHTGHTHSDQSHTHTDPSTGVKTLTTQSSSSQALPQYDHLELVRTSSGGQTTRFSPGPSPSPEAVSRSNSPRPTPPQPLYDQLIAKETSPSANEQREESMGGTTKVITATGTVVSVPYERKIGVLGHPHTYEYIEVNLRGGRGGGGSGGGGGGGGGGHVPGPRVTLSPSRHHSDPGKLDSESPTPADTPNNEHPDQWVGGSTTLSKNHSSSIVRSPMTNSRKKPLPLQTIPFNEFFNGSESPKVFSEGRSTKNISSEHGGGRERSSGSLEQSHSPPLPQLPFSVRGTNEGTDSPSSRVAPGNGAVANSDRLPPPRLMATQTLPALSSAPLLDDSPPVPPRNSSFTVSLPATNIQFDKPLVPPKPRVLDSRSHAASMAGGGGGVQYAKMRFTPCDNDTNYATVNPNQRTMPNFPKSGGVGERGGGGVGKGEGVQDNTKVLYQKIDFDVTEGLRKTREDREMQRNREIEWLERQQQGQNTFKTLTAK